MTTPFAVRDLRPASTVSPNPRHGPATTSCWPTSGASPGSLAREAGYGQVILHTPEAMRIAWGLYERPGFRRSEGLDCSRQGLPVFGFRLRLAKG